MCDGLNIIYNFNKEWIIQRISLILFTVEEMIAAPFETCSDSFYFVDNKLVMHNKADYAYNGGINN